MAKDTAIERASETGSSVLERVILEGNLAELTPTERVTFYRDLCDSLGLNALSRPFGYITFQGQLRLYPLKDCTDQLRRLHKVSIMDVRSEQIGDLYTVTVKATTADGRSDVDQGVVVTAGLRGEALANQLMKAITKGKRRVTLSICGLSMPDESEIDSIPNARVIRVDENGEILEPPAALPPAQLPPQHATAPATASQPAPQPNPRTAEQSERWRRLVREAKELDVSVEPFRPIAGTAPDDVDALLSGLETLLVEVREKRMAGEEQEVAA